MGSYGFVANKESVNTSRNTPSSLPFRISLNTSTIRAYGLTVEQQIDAVAEAGYDGIELWVSDVNTYLNSGGTTGSLASKLKEKNLVLENMIGFAPWFTEDLEARARGLEQLEREMNMIAAIGGKYIAAPVQGVRTLDRSMLDDYAARYRTILELSDRTGVVPILELWGHAALNNLADEAWIVIASGHTKASMLLDFYHLYRGGNSWETLDLLNFSKMPVFHINDYPATPPREQLRDADRVFPGDGICPFDVLVPRLYEAGFRGAFSLELFNQGYWDTMDVGTLLKTGYQKTLNVLTKSMIGIL
jgi:2-keto-myo-inositol isomerase